MSSYGINFSTVFMRILFFAVVALLIAFIFYGILLLIVPFAISLILSFLLNPLLDYLERLRIPRTAAVLLIIPILSLIFIGLFVVTAKPLEAEFQNIQSQLDIYQLRITKRIGDFLWFLENNLSWYFKLADTNLETLLGGMGGPLKKMSGDVLSAIPTIITYSLITPIITLIFLLQGDTIYHNLMAMVPNRYFEMTLLVVKTVREHIVSYLKGMVIQWFIIALILGIGLKLVGLPYAPVIGILGATLNVVPYVGPVLGIGLGVLVTLITPGVNIWFVLLVFLMAQIIDNGFTQPVILARSAQIHPLISILAIITALSLQSVLLILVAIPLAGILIVSIQVMYRSLKAFRVI